MNAGRLRLHVKNNRAGEEIFRITPERYAAAAARHPDIASRVDVMIDWDTDHFVESMGSADALVTWDLPTEDLAMIAPRLRMIHVIGAGVEHLQPLDWLPRGVSLTNNRGVHAEKTAESALMSVLMLNNRLPQYVTDQRAHRWDPRFTSVITGKTVTVVGVGQMGGAAARAFKRAGLRVNGVRRGGRAHRAVDRMYRTEDLHAAVAEADFVHLTLPLTAKTTRMIDMAAMRAMKPGVGLINFGRGPTLDHEALRDMLRSGHVAGAILDVHDLEPLPADSPIWDAPNLIVLPHVSSDDEDEYAALTLDLIFENLRRIYANKLPKNIIRPNIGY